MSSKTHRKRSGHRKAKKVTAMRLEEIRRHAESSLAHTFSRGEPHVGHTRRQQGETLRPHPQGRQDRVRLCGRPYR
jgi:hypothetical protein